jgi:hypothetical protein
VRPSVHPSAVTDYLRNRSDVFSKTWREIGGKKCKKRSTANFLDFASFSRKIPKSGNLDDFWSIFASFWDLAKNPRRGFFLNFAKMCKNIALKHRTVVSPEKNQFSELFTEF